MLQLETESREHIALVHPATLQLGELSQVLTMMIAGAGCRIRLLVVRLKNFEIGISQRRREKNGCGFAAGQGRKILRPFLIGAGHSNCPAKILTAASTPAWL